MKSLKRKLPGWIVDQREKELIQENTRIKQQLAAAQEEKRILLGSLHEIETQLNSPLTS